MSAGKTAVADAGDERGGAAVDVAPLRGKRMLVVEEALKNEIHLETSSAFDMPMIDALEKNTSG